MAFLNFDPDVVLAQLDEALVHATRKSGSRAATVRDLVHALRDDHVLVAVKSMRGSLSAEYGGWDSFGHLLLATRQNHFSLYADPDNENRLFLQSQEQDLKGMQKDFESHRLRIKVLRCSAAQVQRLNDCVERAAHRIRDAVNLNPIGGIGAEIGHAMTCAVDAAASAGHVFSNAVAYSLCLFASGMLLSGAVIMRTSCFMRNMAVSCSGFLATSSMFGLRNHVRQPALEYEQPSRKHTNCVIIIAEVCLEADFASITGLSPAQCYEQFGSGFLDAHALRNSSKRSLETAMRQNSYS
ncbi:hypothetical protein FVE85_5188 [Porphyridium purpureum]|uniref:Uncharacterized protein n=1 Tax=Porphyridium purpureum TaxID=35688 RepID=A0A5J4Z3R8_PORPP|nr:hypothetical protein FVE85_5188 [Porphyridium purpureum]|eukprot:POR3338..scf295_1